MSSNHKAFVAVTVHLEQDGQPILLLLDITKLTVSHSGDNLATAFTKILKDYKIPEKVSI